MQVSEDVMSALREHARTHPGDVAALVWRLEDGTEEFSGFSRHARAIEIRHEMLSDNPGMDMEKDTRIIQLWKLED